MGHQSKESCRNYLNWKSTKLTYLKRAHNRGAKKIIFTACHLGRMKLAFTSPDVISTSPKNILTSRIDFIVLLLFEFDLKKHHLPIGQVKNRIHQPDSKIYFFLSGYRILLSLCTDNLIVMILHCVSVQSDFSIYMCAFVTVYCHGRL